VSSVQIYAKSLNLIELWSKKAEIAGGRPFNAQQDVFDAAMDMVNAAAFAFDDNMGIIKRNLSSFGSINNALTPDESETDQPVEFSRVPVTPEISAMQGVVRFLGTQSVSPWPFLTYWYNMLTNTNLRSQFRMKDDVIKKQLAISGKRLEAGDKAQFSATDYLVQREYSVARKENRTPNLYSRRTIDEVSRTFLQYISFGVTDIMHSYLVLSLEATRRPPLLCAVSLTSGGLQSSGTIYSSLPFTNLKSELKICFRDDQIPLRQPSCTNEAERCSKNKLRQRT
jgi:hypothetical protein